MNLVNITDNDIKLMYKLICKEGLSDDELEELTNKLEYCVEQIDTRNEFMDKVEEINKKYQEKLKKEDK